MNRAFFILLSVVVLAGCEKHEKLVSQGGTLEPIISVADAGSGNGDVRMRTDAFTWSYSTQFSSSFETQLPYGSSVTLSLVNGSLQQWTGGPCHGTATSPCTFFLTEDVEILAVYN